jgi:hypothetical protein
MADRYEEKERFDGTKVQILVPDYSEPTDYDRYTWRTNIERVNMGEGTNPVNKYLTTAERYFCSKDWFGSEKRKNPA